jgi:CubicO group peptidase (beta-lactamase class C family)
MRHYVTSLIFLIVLTVVKLGNASTLPEGTPESVGLSSSKLDNILPTFKKYIDNGQVPCLSVAVVRHGKIAYFNKSGLRDIENNLPIERDTIFRIYSMSKAITSVAAMILYEEGHFELIDPVSDYLPEFTNQVVYVSGWGDSLKTRIPDKPMTIQQLFTHTSGISYGNGVTAVDSIYNNLDIWNSHTLEELTNRIAKAPLMFEPGSEWSYGFSIDVLGRLIEVVSGQTLGDFLNERLFTPLGMVDTGFYVKQKQAHRFSVMYRWVESDSLGLGKLKPILGQTYTDRNRLQLGGSGLVSTVDDYLKFCQMILNEGTLNDHCILSSRTVRFMLLNHLPSDVNPDLEGLGHGLGFGILTDPTKLGRIGNIGEASWGGYANTFFWIDPKEQLISMVWTQMIPWGIRDFRHQLLPLVHSSIVD